MCPGGEEKITCCSAVAMTPTLLSNMVLAKSIAMMVPVRPHPALQWTTMGMSCLLRWSLIISSILMMGMGEGGRPWSGHAV